VAEHLYRTSPHLIERITGLWRDDEALSYPGYLELSVVAHHGGLFFSTDADELFGALEELCANAPLDVALPSETPLDQQRTHKRLSVLRSSARRRRNYVEVLSTVWSMVRNVWEQEGLPAVERETAARLQMLERRPTWREFTARDQADDAGCPATVDLDRLDESLGPADEMAVVPCYFTLGGLAISLPRLLVVGIGTDGAAASDRAQAELLARRLKAAADPTRLALLAGLARREMTISELAHEMALAQPTVSNHVKLLRDAGLVQMRMDGRHRYLTLQGQAFRELDQDLRHLLRIDGPDE
jgi:DNA-binding transcriptional ArsR family regulator